MEVRRNNSTGIVLFSGTLQKGDKKKFKGKDIWMSLGAPANVQAQRRGQERQDQERRRARGPVEVIQGRVVQGPDTQG